MSTAPAMLAFHFEDSQLRAFDEDGEAWFVAQDVCAMLGLGNPTRALANLDDDEKGLTTSNTLGGFQQLLIVSESGLYAMIFRSRKPVAKKIRKWVTQEVLPTIRRTGRYELPSNDDAASTEQPGREPFVNLESPDDVDRVRVMIALVREARYAYGPKSARALWENIGLPDIERVKLPTGKYLVDEVDDSVRQWLEARCELVPGARIKSMDLFIDYRGWCAERDIAPCAQQGFGRQLTRAKIPSFHSNCTWRRGIRLKD